MKKSWWIALIVVLFIVGFAGGVIYWSFVKTKNIANSALDAAKNIQTLTTPTPSLSISSTPVALSLPTADVPGQDLPDIPRYKGSMRTAYDQNDDGSEVNLEYVASASAQEILDFYKKTLVEKGWTLFAEGFHNLNFSQGETDVSIEIVEANNGLTQYRIHSFQTQKTE
jgi:hypothetical protein